MVLLIKALWLLGSSTILGLGVLHLVYTLFTKRLFPRVDELMINMKASHPALTSSTTMWKAWIGFNCSHSTGAIFFGLINIYLVVNYFVLIEKDIFFILINLFMAASYFWLGLKYWFRIPLIGITVTLACYTLAGCISWLS